MLHQLDNLFNRQVDIDILVETEGMDLIVVERAKSPAIASLIVQILKFEGIPAYVGGCLLQDEFAISQRMVGNNCVDIQIPRSCLREARRALRVLKESGKLLDDQEHDAEDEDNE